MKTLHGFWRNIAFTVKVWYNGKNNHERLIKMNNKNTVFQEEYKRLDALCRDVFASRDGVSEYIRQMELVSYAERRYYADWETDYKQLKHLRWIRNRLAHEVGTLDENFCTDTEIEWLKKFHQSILNISDPLSVIRKGKQETAQQYKQNHEHRKNSPSVSKSKAEQIASENAGRIGEKRESGWSIFIAKIKRLFSK